MYIHIYMYVCILQSIGTSGMTILEELMDVSLRACEKGRASGQKHLSRGAALLGPAGKVEPRPLSLLHLSNEIILFMDNIIFIYL